MYDYTVIDVSRPGAGKGLCLADEAGELHVARTTAIVPRVGSRLLGNSPRLGFGILLGQSFDEVFRVVFEVVNCSREEASWSLHRSLTP